MFRIEHLPFFRGYDQSGKKAIIDVEVFEKWLDELDVEFLTPDDFKDRQDAYKELERGKAIDLKEAMKAW